MSALRYVIAACTLFTAACASAPSRSPGNRAGYQDVHIELYGFDMPWQGAASRSKLLEGGTCALRNDKGSWDLVAPGNVAVEVSETSLHIECRAAGYKPIILVAACSNLKAPTLGTSALGSGLMTASPAVGIIAGIAILGLAAQSAAASHGEGCDYSRVSRLTLYLLPEGSWP